MASKRSDSNLLLISKPIRGDAEIVEVEIEVVSPSHRPFGELRRAKIVLSPVWCSRPTTAHTSSPCHDEFRGRLRI
ncbi:hypothetical protein TNCV_1328681 [Trichonephila clavipes]|nr:hypothetical protein TNCV_1328681 [Trichonephila clavipes]